MSLAQRYRLQFTQPRHRWMAVYVVSAIFLNLGFLAMSLGWWSQLQLPDFTDQSATQLPIEFVPVDGLEVSPSPDTERVATQDSVAGGVQNPDLPVGVAPSGTALSTPGQSSQPRSPSSSPSIEDLRNESATSFPPADSPSIRTDTNFPSPQTPPSISPSPARSSRRSPESSANTTSTSASDLLTDSSSSALTADGSSVVNPNRSTDGAIGVDASSDSVWAPYLAELREKIRQRWQIIGLDNSREVEVQFVVNRQGQLTSANIVRSSGSSTADSAALQAIQSAAPFNPLPAEATEPSLIVNFTFTYTVR